MAKALLIRVAEKVASKNNYLEPRGFIPVPYKQDRSRSKTEQKMVRVYSSMAKFIHWTFLWRVVMFSPEVSHADQSSVTHVVVMDRFALHDIRAAIWLLINLFDQGGDENFSK